MQAITVDPANLPAGPKRVHSQGVAGGFEVEALQGSKEDSSTAWVVRGKKGLISFSGLWVQEVGKGVKSISLWSTGDDGALQQCNLTAMRSFLEKS